MTRKENQIVRTGNRVNSMTTGLYLLGITCAARARDMTFSTTADVA
jgi:hypothetical protein